MTELLHTEILCDNEQCDFVEENVAVSSLKEWVNRPCPKCGENLLTEQDYENSLVVDKTMEMLRRLSPNKIKMMYDAVPPEAREAISEALGLKDGDNLLEIGTHGKVTINGVPTDEIIKKLP